LRRRPDRGLLALLPPVLVFVAFGAARVDAPVSLIGLLFDRPAQFAYVATVLVFAGAGLLFVRPIERRFAGVIAPSREPTPDEAERLRRLLSRLRERSGIDTTRLIVRVQRSDQLNAAAGAAHLLFVSEAALRCADPELEALLAHELGHHRGLHPVITAVVWWLSLPGEALAAAYRALRRVVLRLSHRIRVLAIAAQVLLIAWQLTVMWLYYAGKLLTLRAARVSEFVADRAAADWGYARELATLYASLVETPPQGRLARLTADHPPTPLRIERLLGRVRSERHE
jgi:Zn-dependent protease with chaperone function